MQNKIRVINLNTADLKSFKAQYCGCVILTKEEQILLQHRGENCFTAPGFISMFGGKLEENETPLEAIQRELKEELGAEVNAADLILLGAVTEASSGYTELVYEFFWHDKHGSITGCYEESPCYFNNIAEVMHVLPKLVDDVPWGLDICRQRGLIHE